MVLGSRRCCRAAIRWARAAGDPAGALQLQSSLGALLMTQPSRLQDSLRWLDETLEQVWGLVVLSRQGLFNTSAPLNVVLHHAPPQRAGPGGSRAGYSE